MVRAVSHRPFNTEPGFDSRSVHAGFVVVDSGSGVGSCTSTGVSPVTFIPPTFHIHSPWTIRDLRTRRRLSTTRRRTVYLWNCGNSDPAPTSHCTATRSRNALTSVSYQTALTCGHAVAARTKLKRHNFC